MKKINEYQCPLCGGDNTCGAHKESPCWCFGTGIPQALIDRISPDKRMKACICNTCVERHQQTQQQQ